MYSSSHHQHNRSMIADSCELTFFINGRKIVLHETQIKPSMTLLQYVRSIGLTGTKLGCGEGGCGACAVMLSKYDRAANKVVHYSVNACLTPLCSLDGLAVTTIEGIGGMREGLHPVQQRIAIMHGSQCGFCTPGIVMAIYAKLRSDPCASPHDLESCLDGNLCRCTGYRPIIDAARSLSNNKAAVDVPQSGCCMGGGGNSSSSCHCKDTMNALRTDDSTDEAFVHHNSELSLNASSGLADELTAKGQTEPIFPPFLVSYVPKSLKLSSDKMMTWYQPLTLNRLLNLKASYPQARIVVGNTEVGIEVKFKGMEYQTLINPIHVEQLKVLRIERTPISNEPNGVTVGAAVSINKLCAFVDTVDKDLSATNKATYRARGLMAIRNMLSWFASNHIRNVACVGGNIVTASPISDLNPLLIACSAVLKANSIKNSSRIIPIDKFFLGYRRVDLCPDEILESLFVPLTSEFEFVLPFKQARRREDDISIVTAGIRVCLQYIDGEWKVKSCAIAYGGLAPTTVLALQTAAFLTDSTWSHCNIQTALLIMKNEFNLPADVPGGQVEYRQSLALSFFFKAFITITMQLEAYVSSTYPTSHEMISAIPSIEPFHVSATRNFITEDKAYSRAEQSYFDRQGTYLHKPHPLTDVNGKPDPDTSFPPASNGEGGSVGKSLMHRNAEAQVSGSAIYTDDMPLPSNALHACLVTSTKAHARIVFVDLQEAQQCSGFVAYLCAKDITGCNLIGAVVKDEEVFATEYVKHYGAVIGVILADTHEQAVAAARKVRVDYEDLPAIISIDDAIAHNSFFPHHHEIKSGDMEAQKSLADIHISGEGKIGGQEHFYLETNCTVVLPSDNGHLEVHSSTQNCSKTQHLCASVCGLPDSKVVAKCKRMGGAFGGKESRSVFIAVTAALGAHLLKRPVSINVERDVDMSITGQRHSFQYKYKAGMSSSSGELKYLEVQLYSNAGFSLDLSQAVMDRALFHVDNVYKWPAYHVRGSVCRTNQPSHTAFRGFGGPQGMIVTETIMQHFAEVTTAFSLEQIKRSNMYAEGDRTPFGVTLESFIAPTLWDRMMDIASVSERKQGIVQFNQANRWRKRGLAVTATKFGINFTANFMNKGGALVHVYTDGSVLIAIGGTEMGQGLFTKIIQIASQCFGISEDLIIISETSTSTIANASPTAASMSIDLYGMAALDACEQINRRLEPLRKQHPTADWVSLINIAFFDRVDLSAHGYHRVDPARVGYDWDKVCLDNAERGMAFNYFTMGVACTEVEIDCLTGDSQVIRSDILMDVGKSINPAIDIGQIEGAFVQGYGWSTMEELVWGDKDHAWVRPGQLHSRGPGTYKIPSFNDVPLDLRVHLSDTNNKFAVHSSKAIGEPPFFLGTCAYFAIKDAILSARKENGYHDYYQLQLPASSERIRMACCDDIVKLCCDASPSSNAYQPKGSW